MDLHTYCELIKHAKKDLQKAKKVMFARLKSSNNQVVATQLLASKYGQAEAHRLISQYWTYWS